MSDQTMWLSSSRSLNIIQPSTNVNVDTDTHNLSNNTLSSIHSDILFWRMSYSNQIPSTITHWTETTELRHQHQHRNYSMWCLWGLIIQVHNLHDHPMHTTWRDSLATHAASFRDWRSPRCSSWINVCYTVTPYTMQVESGGGGLVRGALVASQDGNVEGEEGQP